MKYICVIIDSEIFNEGEGEGIILRISMRSFKFGGKNHIRHKLLFKVEYFIHILKHVWRGSLSAKILTNKVSKTFL